MDLPSQEVEIPMPLNTAYGGAHVTNMIHHTHDHHAEHDHPSNGASMPMPMTQNHDHQPIKKHQQKVRYRECLKNHAASMGGNATDGCGEFMPSGEEGSIEALTCSACNCHRNFHRKEVEGEISSFSPLMYDYQHHLMINSRGRKVINLGHHKNMLYSSSATAGALVPAGGGGPRYSMGPLLIPSDQSDDQEEELGAGGVAASGGDACRALPPPPPSSAAIANHQQNQYYLHHHNQMLKKRFRTKFTTEQKEKMMSFAEKVGWKIQKQEESVVQQFCQEIGVKRRVLKVWMHNNKHSLKKNSAISNA